MIRSYAFKPNFYETKEEKKLLIVDGVRILLTLAIALTILIIKVVQQVRTRERCTLSKFANYLISVFIILAFIVQATMCFLLTFETVQLIEADHYINSYKFAMYNYYMIFFETLGLLLMALIILKFTRISRKLSIMYAVMERPLVYLSMLLLAMGFIYAMLGFTAMQMWGTYIYEFRTLSAAFQTMFTMFTLHWNQMFELGMVYPLYRFNEWWVFFFLMLYLVFL